MYKVIKMYGDFEPWWFLDGWEEDVVSRVTYERYEEALSAFQKEWVKLSESFPMKKSKNGTMVAFWDESDQYWCEECDEYLQRFHSLMLIESKENLPAGLTKKSLQPRVGPCRLKQESFVKVD